MAVIDITQNILGPSQLKGPHGLGVTPDGRKVYVSGDVSPTVSVIDTARTRGWGIEVGANPLDSPSRATAPVLVWAGARTER